MSVHSRSLLFPRCPWTCHSLPQVTTSPLRPVVSQVNTGRVQQSKPAARLALFLGMSFHRERGMCRDMRRCFSSSHSFCPQSVCPAGELRVTPTLPGTAEGGDGGRHLTEAKNKWSEKERGRDRSVSIHYVICTARSFQNQPYCKCFFYRLFVFFIIPYCVFFLFPIYASWLWQFLPFI